MKKFKYLSKTAQATVIDNMVNLLTTMHIQNSTLPKEINQTYRIFYDSPIASTILYSMYTDFFQPQIEEFNYTAEGNLTLGKLPK